MFESRYSFAYTTFCAKTALKEILKNMINNIFVNLFTILTMMVPVSMHAFISSNSNVSEAEENTEVAGEESDYELLTINTIMQEILALFNDDVEEELAELPVTTMDTSREAIEPEEPTLTPEEEKVIALTEWKTNLPDYESDTPQTDFIEKVAPAAVLIANAQGIYPSVMIAQAGLESSWGRSGLAESYNNLMGTKGNTDGQSVTVRTREVQNGESVYINAGFTIYDSWGHSLFHYGSLMRNGLSWDSEYYSGTWIKNTNSYKDATAWLQGRYASDPAYASKLNQTIESFNLDQYDEIEPFDSELESTLEKLYALHKE